MKYLMIIILLLSTLLHAKNVQLLVKIEAAGLHKNLAAQHMTGVHAVDDVLQQVDVEFIKPVFSDELNDDLNQWITIDIEEKHAADVIRQLQQIYQVKAVSENRAFRIAFTPNDARLQEQWALEKIQAFDAWEIERGSADVLVAIIDTGVDYTHPDLQENIWINSQEDLNGNCVFDIADLNGIDDDANGFIDDVHGWDFTDAPNYPDGSDFLQRDNDPMDEFGHGTGAAGLVAAVADNDIGIAGLANGCKIMNLRAFNGSGYGEEDDVASAILYAIENGASIINMSFGDVFVSRVINDVVRYGVEQGVLMIASAGNAANDFIHYPSGFQGVMSIGSTDDQDSRSGFSNYGPSVDLYAPGTAVLSTTLHSEYKNWNGTSFAAPYVSGAAALLFSHYPDLSAEAARGILVNSTDFINAADSWNSEYAHGRLNIYNALTAPTESVVRILEPALDAGFSSSIIPIVGSVWSPDFLSYSIYYGQGNNPLQWNTVVANISSPVIQDTLLLWESGLPDGEYTLRFEVLNRDNSVEQATTRFFIDSTAPVLSNVAVLPMFDADNPATLVEFQSDDLATGWLALRRENSIDDFDVRLENYRTFEPRVLLSQQDYFGLWDCFVAAKNGAGLVSTDDNEGIYYKVDLSAPQIARNTFSSTGTEFDFGRMLAQTIDFNRNGIPEVVVSQSLNGAIGPIAIYEMQDNAMQLLYQSATDLIPRSVGDIDADGKVELLVGYGFSSWLYEAPGIGDFPSQIAKEWLGDGTTQYWAAAIADADRDGKGEVIMRVIRNAGTPTDQYEVFESTGDNQFDVVAVLPNFTEGENFYGVPHVQVDDFDADGRLEILIGDSDGDIFVYENIADDQYTATWQTRLPLQDAIDYICSGDFDGDGVAEFVAGSHSDPNLNTEHYYDARHWHYQLFDKVDDDIYAVQDEWRFFGFESPSDFLSSVSAGDVDGDGADELMITAFPDFYVVNCKNEQYHLDFYAEQAQNAGIAVADFDADGRNEFWLGNGEQLALYSFAGFSTAPPAPANLSARPLNQSSVFLSWVPTGTAEFYSIYRSSYDAASMQKIAETTESSYMDQDVQEDVVFYYRVYAHDSSLEPSRSLPSLTVSARPGARPRLHKATCETATSLRLFFDKTINNSLKNVQNFLIDETIRPTSVAVYAGGSQALLSFENGLTLGEHFVHCEALYDSQNIPLDTLYNSIQFETPVFESAFYLLSAKFHDTQHVHVQFSDELDIKSAELLNNYTISDYDVLDAQAIGDQVVLQVNSQHHTSDLENVKIRVKNIKSSKGVPIRSGRGDVFVISQSSMPNMQKFTVYPNPWLPVSGTAYLTFTNLEQDDWVKIYTISGRFLTKLSVNADGLAQWNVEQEKNLAPGIYIYHIKKLNKTGKLAIIR